MKLAIFDFDGTLLRVDTLPYMLKLWKALGYPSVKRWMTFARIGGLVVRYKLGLGGLSREQMKKTALQKFNRIFTGMTKAQVGKFFDCCVSPMMEKLNENVVKELDVVKKQGYHTVLLSGCYQGLLQRVGNELGIDTVIGTLMIFNNDLVDIETPLDIKTGIDKVICIREMFADADLSTSCAYTDSLSDIPLLELVGEPVAVVPDNELKDMAEQKKWRIIE